MVTREQIQDLADRIAAEFHPQRVILFGSHARGSAREESDVDILVIMPFQGSVLKRTVEILDRVNPQFPIDLLLRTPEEADWRYSLKDSIVSEAFDKGITLFEAAA